MRSGSRMDRTAWDKRKATLKQKMAIDASRPCHYRVKIFTRMDSLDLIATDCDADGK